MAQPAPPPVFRPARLEKPIGPNVAAVGWHEASAKHQRRANQFLQATREMAQQETLTAGERMRISSNAWGAVSQTVKAIAALHGWTVVGPQNTQLFIRALGERAKDDAISPMLKGVYALHENYYADHSVEQYARDAPYDAAVLIERLWAAEPKLRGGAKPPGAKEMRQETRFKANHTPENIAAVGGRHQRSSQRETRRARAVKPPRGPRAR